jgi:hypothetical protein
MSWRWRLFESRSPAAPGCADGRTAASVEFLVILIIIVVVFVLVRIFLFIEFLVIVVEVVVVVGEIEFVVAEQYQVLAALRTAQGVPLLKVLGVDFVVLAFRAGRHTGSMRLGGRKRNIRCRHNCPKCSRHPQEPD